MERRRLNSTEKARSIGCWLIADMNHSMGQNICYVERFDPIQEHEFGMARAPTLSTKVKAGVVAGFVANE